MTWTGDRRDGAGYDPDATVVLPAVTEDATITLPTVPAATGDLPPVSGPAEGAGPGLRGAGSVARNSAVMAAGSVVSRVTGFMRTAAIGAAVGAYLVNDDYTLANTLPNMVYELLLGGVLASVIVPLLVRAQTRDADSGEAYAQRLLSMAAVFLGGATVLAVLCAPLITAVFMNSHTAPADQRLITVFGYLLLPEIFFYGMAALFAAILNTRGHFAAPMWTPILNNIVVILTAGVFVLLPAAGPVTPANIGSTQVLVLGVGTTLGIVVQATGLWPAMRRVGFRWRWRWDWRELRLRELVRISSWMLGYVVVSQVALVVVLKISNVAGSRGAPGPAIFNNAYLIFMMANGIVAVSIMTALMPRMSAAASEHRWSDLAEQLSLGTRLSAVVLIPASVAYVVLGRQLAVTLFNFGDYNLTAAIQTGWVIAAAGVGLVPFAISQLQLFAFYAMPDTRTPALLNLPVAALRVVVDLMMLVALPILWVDTGLMFGNTVSFVVGCGLGYWLLRRRIGRLGLRAVLGTLGRLVAAALVAAVPTALVALLLQHFLGLAKLGSLISLVVSGLVLIAVYLAAAVLLRVREVTEVLGMVRARLGR